MRDERTNLIPPAAVPGPSVRRRRRVDGRAGRWDSRPALTTRDAAALRFIGEHYAVTVDVAAVLLARLATEPTALLSRRTVRQRLGRWEQAGWVERHRMLGQTWILPTRAGLRLAGLVFDCWEPAASRLAHHHAVALVRLHREPMPGQGGWVCERELWRRRGRASWHLADGALPAAVPADGGGLARRGSWSRSSCTRRPVPAWWPPSKLGPRTPPASPTTCPPPYTARCRPCSPASCGSWVAAPRSPWSCCPRSRASPTCPRGVRPRELAS